MPHVIQRYSPPPPFVLCVYGSSRQNFPKGKEKLESHPLNFVTSLVLTEENTLFKRYAT